MITVSCLRLLPPKATQQKEKIKVFSLYGEHNCKTTIKTDVFLTKWSPSISYFLNWCHLRDGKITGTFLPFYNVHSPVLFVSVDDCHYSFCIFLDLRMVGTMYGQWKDAKFHWLVRLKKKIKHCSSKVLLNDFSEIAWRLISQSSTDHRLL